MTTPTREQVIAAFIAEFEPMDYEMKPATCHCCTFADERTQDAFMGFTAGRDQGLREAKEAFSLSEHMHKRNTGLMVCVSDLSAVIVRMAAGIDHLSETARQWEPDHSSGAYRRGWVLATEARDDALRLLKEHADAIEQLKEKT